MTASAGGDDALGYRQPSKWFGPSTEILGTHFEIDVGALYSPDQNALTRNGNQLQLDGGGIFWASKKLGLSADYSHNWFWTSQFSKQGWNSLPGLVVRDRLVYFGRSSICFRAAAYGQAHPILVPYNRTGSKARSYRRNFSFPDTSASASTPQSLIFAIKATRTTEPHRERATSLDQPISL